MAAELLPFLFIEFNGHRELYDGYIGYMQLNINMKRS